MITGNDNLSDLFTIFHDGGVSLHQINNNDYGLEVEINYLAERIDPKYDKFYLNLNNVCNFMFETWPNDAKAAPSRINDPSDVFDKNPDILGGEFKNGLIHVDLNQSGVKCDYCGGTLSFNADSASVFDQGHKEYTLDELKKLSKDYWTEWSKKK